MAPALHEMTPEEVSDELEKFRKMGFARPTRSSVDPSRAWKNGVPEYDVADLAYFRGKTRNHAEGSLESIVENAVKQWECEATHLNFDDWQTVDHATYKVCANGGKTFLGEDGARKGNYNWLLDGADKRLYDSDVETFESSHEKFRSAFVGAFPWEVLHVFSPPPTIAFSWRHWGLFNGVYEGRQGDDDVRHVWLCSRASQ